MRYEVQYLPARMVRKIAEGGEYQNESRMLTEAFVRRLVRAPGHDVRLILQQFICDLLKTYRSWK